MTTLMPFIREELVEARLFFGPDNVKGKSAEQIADIIYLIFMMIEVIRFYKPDWAANYASQTLSYNTYENMHYAGTDLGNLLAVLNNQDTFKAYIKVDGKIAIPLFQINRYLQAIRSKSKSDSEDATFFWRLEDYLRLYSKSLFRQLRRDVGRWSDLTYSDKVALCQILRREFDKRAGNADIYLWFKQSFKIEESIVTERSYMDELFERLEKTGKYSKAQLTEAREGLFENQDQLETVRTFFKLHKQNSLTPTVGKFYAPIGVTFINPLKTLVIDTTSELVELVSMKSNEDYKFKINGKVQQFPDNANTYTSAGDTLFYATLTEAQAMMTLATTQIQFPGWKVEYNLKESVNESIDTKLGYHKFLNPALWDDNEELKDDVKDALAKIANKFSEFIDVKQLKIVDYIITGSNCAFNYTSQSDVDLHILVDATGLGQNPLMAPFLRAKKSLWNSGHDITVKGFTVELYAEDVNLDEDKLVATGIYSLLHDKWIKKPTYETVRYNDAAVQAKAEGIMQQIDMLLAADSDADAEEVRMLWEHIRKMRRAGLEKGGEFSVENLAFKAVRNNGYFDKLRDYETHKEDEDLTLEHSGF